MIVYKFSIKYNDGDIVCSDGPHLDTEKLDEESVNYLLNLKDKVNVRINIPEEKIISFLFFSEKSFCNFKYGFCLGENITQEFEYLK